AAPSAERDAEAVLVNTTATELIAVIDSMLSDLPSNSNDTPVCNALFTALTSFRNRVNAAKNAAIAAQQQAQAKKLLTELNLLEEGYKNWRSDSVEHRGMINAVKNLMVKPGTTDEVNPTYSTIVDANADATKVDFSGTTGILNKIYHYVDGYKVNSSLYSIWSHSNVNSDNQIAYNENTVMADGKTTVSDKTIELQSLYGNWTTNSDTRMRLLKACYEIITGRSFDGDKPQNSTEEDFAESKSKGSWGTSLQNYKKAFAYVYKTVFDYNILQTQIIPSKCIPKVVGTTESITLLPTHIVTQSASSVKKVIALTAIEQSSDFIVPSQDTIPTAAWESAKVVLDNLKHTGEDSFETYVKNQSSELEKLTNRVGKNGFYKITQILNELEEKIDIFRLRSSSIDQSIALALVKWYNAVVDYAAQYIKIDLQEYINDSAHLNSKEWASIGKAKNKNLDVDDQAALGDDTSWSVQTPSSEKDATAKATKTMLKYIMLDGNVIKYVFPGTGNNTWIANGNTILGQIQTLKSGFINQNSVGSFLIDDLTKAQQQLENLLQQYNALTEEQKKGYDSTTIRAYIQNLKTIVTNNLGNLDEKTGQFILKSNVALPVSTQEIYKKLLENLNNLQGAFESIIISKNVKIFEDWFINIEKIYYDWRIDSKNRKKLLEQLSLFKGIIFEFQLPSAIANDEALTLENVEIRQADEMSKMMGNIRNAVSALNSILKTVVVGNNKEKKVVDNGNKTIPDTLNDIEAANKNSGYLATARSNLATAKGEFRSMDDYFTCSNVIENLSILCQDMRTNVTNVPAEKIDAWKETMSSSGIILRMASNSPYFSADIISHISEIETYIKQYDVQDNDGKIKDYHKIANRYGYTGDYAIDQTAIIRQMDVINKEIEKEFATENPHRDVDLLSAKISGQPVTFSVDNVCNSIDRCTKYYESWLDFERYASYLITNFMAENVTVENVLNAAEEAIIERIRDGTDNNCRTLLDLFEQYEPINTGDDYEKLLFKLQTISAINEKNTELLNIFNRRKFTEIDYTLQDNDFKVDILKIYKDLFIEDTSVFKKLRQYISGQNAYTTVVKYINDLFKQFPNWRNNGEENNNLRRCLVNLKSSALYRSHDPIWQIASALNSAEQTTVVSNSKGSCYLTDITAIVTITNLGSSQEGTLSDYVSTLINYVYSYNALADPRAIYASRIEAISDTIKDVLGNSQADHTVLFGVSSEALIVGGQLIPDGDKMAHLIIALEDLVQKWNREDEGATRTIFESMNPDGTFFLQSDGTYQLQAKDVAMPKNGTVKSVSGDMTTVNVYVDGAISSTTSSATIKNRIVTNELLSVVDSLKNIYVNGPLFRNVAEIYHRLKMAEYLYSVVGETIKNVVWHAPTNDLIDQTNRTFLASQGCYTFTMGDTAQVFVCGLLENGTIQISKLPSNFTVANLREGIAGNVISKGTEKKNPIYEAIFTTHWFLGLKGELGVFYALDDKGKVSNTELNIVANGKSYYSLNGNILDENGNAMTIDKDGFIIDLEGTRIVREITGNSTVYTAYKIDVITGRLLCIPYDPETKSEKTKASVDDSGIYQEYDMRFGAYKEMFHSHADYLKNENIHALFMEEVNNIGISFGIMYESWKISASNSIFGDAAKKFSTKLAQFVTMFSTISDMLGRHDVSRYNDKLAYETEQQMIRGINIILQNTNNVDKGFQNFANIATKAKQYYTLMCDLATAKGTGNVESAKQYA
ncbi:MAG: hypothetical protein LBB34_03805, partial [Holosporales bacterium]|nr:hypothetical protein [Holosporales bacterium]